jgi:hypothetical protein
MLNFCGELIPDIEKFLLVAIFKMAPQYRTNSTLFDFNWPLTTGLKNKSKATFEIEQC